MSAELEITEELIARQSPEAQAIIRLLLGQIAKLTARVAELESRLGKTPQNSSLPPSPRHPHAKPAKRQGSGQVEEDGQNVDGLQPVRQIADRNGDQAIE